MTADTPERPIDAVGVIGLGYVGLTEAVAFAESGLRVTGFDVDRDRVVDLASTVVDLRNAAKHVAARRKHVVRL